MPGDNGSDSYNTYQYDGDPCGSPSTGSTPLWFRVRLGPRCNVSEAWGGGLTSNPIAVTVEYFVGFSNRTPYLIWQWTWWGPPIILSLNIGLWRCPGGIVIRYGDSPSVKGHIWFTDGFPLRGGTGAGVFGQPQGRRLSFPLGRHAPVFQAKGFATLACAHDIQHHGTPDKHVSICSDSLAALKALGPVRPTSPLVRQC
jgi:hypothetical protein